MTAVEVKVGLILLHFFQRTTVSVRNGPRVEEVEIGVGILLKVCLAPLEYVVEVDKEELENDFQEKLQIQFLKQGPLSWTLTWIQNQKRIVGVQMTVTGLLSNPPVV